MDKNEERELLAKVFGDETKRAQASEKPDFLIPTWRGSAVLGVEVTSAYASNAAAKLKKLPDYWGGLLDGTTEIHRADRGMFEVGPITIIAEDGTEKAQVTAIIQDIPSPKAGVDLLIQRIAEKEQKVPEYLKQCTFVDLIIEDGSHGFFHKTREEFYRRFAGLVPKTALTGSAFREIYLVTSAETGREVYVPMIANAFVCDLWAYVDLLEPEFEAKRQEREIVQILAACMFEEGYRNCKMAEHADGSTSFFSGAWEMLFMDDKSAIRDWRMFSDEYEGRSLEEFLDGAAVEIREQGKRLNSLRRTRLAAIDMRLPVKPGPLEAEEG